MNNQIPYLILKAVLSGALIVTIRELAKKNNLAAVIVHSLPLVSVMAFMWMFMETRDTALIARHSFGTFWFVLPTLPLFLALPWLLNRGWKFPWALALAVVMTVLLYASTLRLLKIAGVKL